MQSAFGVEHGVVSKALSPGQVTGLRRTVEAGGDGAKYAQNRLAAHEAGRVAGQAKAESSAAWSQGNKKGWQAHGDYSNAMKQVGQDRAGFARTHAAAIPKSTAPGPDLAPTVTRAAPAAPKTGISRRNLTLIGGGGAAAVGGGSLYAGRKRSA